MPSDLKFLQFVADKIKGSGGDLKILGKKLPPPSQRITIVQKGLKINEVKIVKLDKGLRRPMTVARVNHLRKMGQVRLHTKETLFPGNYEILIKLRH